MKPIEEGLSPETENPVDGILRAAAARLGVIEGRQHDAGGAVPMAGMVPNFETGVNEDGEDVDVFITEYDYTEGPNLTAIE